MNNVEIRPEAIKLNSSSNTKFEKEFKFITKDEIEIIVPFKISEEYINMILNRQEGMDLIINNYPNLFENGVIKEGHEQDFINLALSVMVQEATKDANLLGVNGIALKEIEQHIFEDEEVKGFFALNGVLVGIFNE